MSQKQKKKGRVWKRCLGPCPDHWFWSDGERICWKGVKKQKELYDKPVAKQEK